MENIAKTLTLIVITVFLTSSCSNSSSSHYFKNGNAKYSLKDYKGAIEDYQEAIKINPDFADAWYGKAICESILSKYDDALTDFNKAAELDPSNKDIIFNRAYYVKQKTGDYEGAIEDYNYYINRFKENDDAFLYNNMGFCKYKLSDFEAAMSDINKSLEFNPNNPMAYKNRALVYLATGNTENACNDLHNALELGFTKKFGNEVEELIAEKCKN
jgi:serine/threonine-protein kinase